MVLAPSTVNLGPNQEAQAKLFHPVFKERYSAAFVVWLGTVMANWEFGLGAYVCVCFSVSFLCLGIRQLVVSLVSLMPWGVGWGWVESIQVAKSMGFGVVRWSSPCDHEQAPYLPTPFPSRHCAE